MLPRRGGFPPTVFVGYDGIRLDHTRLQMMQKAKVELPWSKAWWSSIGFPLSSHTCCPPCPTKHISTLR